MFPESTLVGKKIPKQRFYDNVGLSASVKKKFVDQIDKIVFVNKFSKDTLNIPKTDTIEEVFVFDVSLKDDAYIDTIEGVLGVIDQSVPYPILFIITIDDQVVMYKIAYKQRNKIDANKSVIDIYLSIDNLDLNDNIFNSINMEIVYEKILRLFLNGYEELNIENAIQKYKSKESLNRELKILEKKIAKEKQQDKHYNLYNQIQRIKRELGSYN